MPENTVTYWFGDLVSHPSVIVDAHTAEDAPICSMSATGSRRTDRRCCPIPGTATS
jgi:hypothetical protein